MTNSQKVTVGVLTILACVIWLVVLYGFSQTYHTWSQRPLGPTLAYPTELPLPATWTASPIATLPTSTFAPTIIAETQTPVSPFAVCNNQLPTMMVLVAGTDVRPGEHRYGLTDVLRAVRVDFQRQRVAALEFPHDLWVYVPGIEQNLKTDHQKLNTAYAYGSPDYGPILLARTMKLNFDLKVGHYLIVNMNVFTDLVNTLGGLDVTIPPGGIDGRTRTDRSERLVFPEGLQHLNGDQALTLAHVRNQSVFVRAEHQNLVLCALHKKIESPEILLKLPAIINSFMKNIQTDLTPEQISQLACLGTQMPRSNILFASFPPELFHTGEVYDPVLNQKVFIWDANYDLLRSYVSKFQEGTWPSATPDECSESGPSTCK